MPEPLHLATAAWPTVAAAAASSVVAIPLGSTEQHGPHLPFTTDTDIAVTLAHRLAGLVDGVVVAPPLAYGSSGEHAGFPGTLSIGAGAVEQVVIEMVRSADAFGGVVLVCAHGGNAAPLTSAVATLRHEGRKVMAWSLRVEGGDAHAGRTETSIMLALRAESVALERATAGCVDPINELMVQLKAGGVRSVAPNGVLGDPAGASTDEGRALLATLADDLAAAVRNWQSE